MRKRPLVIWLVGIGLILSPLVYALAPMLLGQLPRELLGRPAELLERLGHDKQIAMALGPVVGALVLRLRPAGWYSLMAFSLFAAYATVRFVLQHGWQKASVWVASSMTLFVVGYFVRREIRSPYFNPRLRWWEHARVRYRLRVEIEGRETIDSESFDISDTGVFLCTEADFKVGETLAMRMHLPDGVAAVTGVVVRTSRSEERPRGIGVRFSATSKEVTQALKVLRKTPEAVTT